MMLVHDTRNVPRHIKLAVAVELRLFSQPSELIRSPACDATKALSSLKPLLGDSDLAPETLPWPDDFTADGRHAVYLFEGDLFLLDLKSSRFTRLSKTLEDTIHRQLMVKGEIDDIVKAGVTFDMMIYPNAKHHVTDPLEQIHLHKTMLEFWQNRLR